MIRNFRPDPAASTGLFGALAALLGALFLALPADSARATEVIDRRNGQPGTFPVIQAETLRGRQVRLPDQLKGDRNLLVVAFEREQQADVDTWLAALDTMTAKPPAFAYYEIPTIGNKFKLMRPVIDAGMKQGIADRAQRDRVITLYIDVDWLRGQIGVAKDTGIVAMLVDRAGTITGRWYGPYTAAAGAELRALLAASR